MFASFCKNIASSRWGHRGFESRDVKFFTRISRENKIYTNIDLAIPLRLEFRESDRSYWTHGFKFLCSRVSITVNITFSSSFNFIDSSNYIMETSSNKLKKLVSQPQLLFRTRVYTMLQAICTMASFYYYDQNPSGYCFLVQIKAFVN